METGLTLAALAGLLLTRLLLQMLSDAPRIKRVASPAADTSPRPRVLALWLKSGIF